VVKWPRGLGAPPAAPRATARRRESRTDRLGGQGSDSAAVRHPAVGSTRHRMGPSVGGPFDALTL